jgi:hypothetical protein
VEKNQTAAIFKLQEAVPFQNQNPSKVNVPLSLRPGSVFINAPFANFADGFTIAKGEVRFFQAKSSEDGKCATLNLLEELYKTGLLRSSCKMKRGLAAYLLKNEESEESATSNEEFEESDSSDHELFENHNYSLSQLCQNIESPRAKLTKEISFDVLKENDSDETGGDYGNYVAVFGTNCKQFHIPQFIDISKITTEETLLDRAKFLGYGKDKFSELNNTLSKEERLEKIKSTLLKLVDGMEGLDVATDISQGDVNSEGILEDDKIPVYIKKLLRRKVELRFEFYSNKR